MQNALLSLDSLDEEELHQLRKKYKTLGTDEVSDPVAPPRDEPDIAL